MKYLIMTEGSCEKALLDVLLNRNLLKFELEDLLYEQVFHARQLTSKLKEMIDQLTPCEEIKLIRIGDKLSDELSIDEEYRERIVCITKICIKPEFEILHILNENGYAEYLKTKSTSKPSEFYKIHNCHYRKLYQTNFDYFQAMSNEQLIKLIALYDKKRKRTHGKNEFTIRYILK